MAVTSARSIVNMKEKNRFEHENARINKYTLADELPVQLSELRLQPPEMAPQKPSYTIRKINDNDKERVLKFLRRFFFRDEPMNLAVKLLETPESRCYALEEYATKSVKEGVSVAAVDEDGEFVGVILNGIARRKDALNGEDSEEEEECPDPKFRRIIGVLEHLDREAKMWEKLPASVNKVMEVKIASTHSDWRGRGLMRVLCEESERIAKAEGAGAMRMDTTSAFSAAAAERLNYKKVYEVSYSSLPDAPQPDAPHLLAKVYLKEL